ncbi:MAG: hypothetical protein V1674_03630 [Candidatus Omnitrophota bacterium]
MKAIIIIAGIILVISSVVFAQDQKIVNKVLDQIEETGSATEATQTNNLQEITGISQEMIEYYNRSNQPDEVSAPRQGMGIVPEANYSFEIGPEVSIFHYEEPPISVKWDGILSGFYAGITGRSPRNLVGRIESQYLYGRVDYDGSLNTGEAWTDEGPDYIFELRGLIGRDFKINTSTFTPIIGIGYRYWNDNLESQYAYEREVNYVYIPLGFEINSPFNRKMNWGIKAEYDVFAMGTVKSHLSDVNSSFGDLKNDQNDGFGVRASVYLKSNLSQKFSFSVEPFIRYWDIEQSSNSDLTYAGSIVGYGYEPANETTEYGVRASLMW